MARLPWLAVGGMLLVAALVLTWEGGVLWGKQADAVEDWSEEVAHLSYQIADSVSTALAAVDTEADRHLLPLVQSVLLGRAGPPQALTAFQGSAERLRQIRSVALFGAGGELVVSSDPALHRRGVSVEDRDFFQLLRFNGAASYTTAANLSGSLADETLSRLSILSIRGLRNADGLFGGVLVVVIDPEILVRVRLDSPVLKRAEIRLFEENGRLITVPASGLKGVGARYADSALFKQMEEGLPLVGLLPNPFSGNLELAALRRVGHSRLLVSVKIEGGPQQQHWWYTVAACLGGALLLFGAGIWLVLQAGGFLDWFVDQRQGGEE
jgi:hypothetical protein